MVAGEGANACVFRPALPCADGTMLPTRPAAIGKVMKLNLPGIADGEAATAAAAAGVAGANAPAFLARCPVRNAGPAARCRGYLQGALPLGFPSAATLQQVVLEDAGNVTLDAILSGDGAVDERLFAAFADVLRTVAALERAGYAHLDLHPGNILVPAPGRMRVIDYGWLRPVDTVWTSASLLRAFFLALTSPPPDSPHNERDARHRDMAREAVEAVEAVMREGNGEESRSLAALEAAGVDALASGAILWRMLRRGPVPTRRRREYLAIAAGLTHPDARRRMRASDALALLFNK